MNPLSVFKSLFEILQGEDDPSHIAAGFAFGAALGLIPKENLFAVLFFLLFFLFRVDKGAALISAALFTPLGYGLDSLAHRIGYGLLLSPSLKPLWIRLYNLPLVPWTKFNNTIVLGNLVLGVLLYVPLYLCFKRLVLRYRANWKAKVDALPWVKALKATNLVTRYMTWKKKLG